MNINIERLKSSTRIHRRDEYDFGPNGDFAEVQDVEFDGYGYTVTALMIHPDFGYATDREVQFFVDAGQSVDFGGIGEPKLRDEADVERDEWQAKADAIEAQIDRLQGRVARNVDAELLGAVADAVGVEFQAAAE